MRPRLNPPSSSMLTIPPKAVTIVSLTKLMPWVLKARIIDFATLGCDAKSSDFSGSLQDGHPFATLKYVNRAAVNRLCGNNSSPTCFGAMVRIGRPAAQRQHLRLNHHTLKYLVALCITISMPCSSGLNKYGVKNVLSQMVIAPTCLSGELDFTIITDF